MARGGTGALGPAKITAVLGPTNTGKTYLAIERMLGHRSGMIGFPLRLLARENYDRAVKLRGARQVALITGEEKIVPPSARYFFCTVESMPLDRQVEFLAVDEIQLCADPDRGHVFTDRLLHARGIAETMFLGSDTIAPLLRRLVPDAEIVARPRFSTLSYAGDKKLTRLPARSAVVAFSAAEVYAIAELIRRQRGGAAVVLGALSPRTRNAQVALFEEGEVDYLVATDAIGMGLNLNLDHVAFANLTKFDGRMPRRLSPAEIGQIAGRAGRHMNDGTFGTTGEAGLIEGETVEAVESHRFDPLSAIAWRNRTLDFRSPRQLIASLEARPTRPELYRAREAEDHLHLAALARDDSILKLASDSDAVALLWEVCKVPDFENTRTDQHPRLLAKLYHLLMKGDGRLPQDWIAKHLAALDRTDGDIGALTARITQGRTWTFITHRADWLDESAHWQEKTRAIEDRLSDALHERLTQRFVDRRAAALLRQRDPGEKLMAGVRANGEVTVEGEIIGHLEGFRFRMAEDVARGDGRAAQSAARRVLMEEMPRRIRQLEADDDGSFLLEEDGRLTWRGARVARLAAGPGVLAPEIVVDASEFLDGAARERLRRRLQTWLTRYLGNRLAPLMHLQKMGLSGHARGLAYQLAEGLGSLSRHEVKSEVHGLDRQARKSLRGAGVTIGEHSLYLGKLLTPKATRLRLLLAALHREASPESLPETGGPVVRDVGDDALTEAAGYRVFRRGKQSVALRVDHLEELAGRLRRLAPAGPFTPLGPLSDELSLTREDLRLILPKLGFQPQDSNARATGYRPRGDRREKPAHARGRKKPAKRAPISDSPFAALAELKGRL